MKKTKIVATLGPASETYERIEALAEAGVNVFRLNFSHGNHAYHGELIKKVKRLNRKGVYSCAILLDTKGPEIRSGDLKKPIEVKKGERLIISTEPGDYEETGKIGVSYDDFINDVEVGSKILVDSGVINLTVLDKTSKDVICEVLDGGEITSRRHLNIPGKDVSLESITNKDWEDIKFGVEMGIDFIALSFVRRATEINELKAFLEKEGAKIDVIAKIESYEATQHLGTITEAADGIMVARGDLGAEVPFAEVPRLQREMIETCAQYHKPVIVATHMLESMIENPVPTRAEVTDVSEAVWQRADATMLSGESAGGKYPIKSVQTMAEIAEVTENETHDRHIRNLDVSTARGAFGQIAAKINRDLPEVEAIVAITRSGETARKVSAFRPNIPIYAFTNETPTRRKLSLCWGVEAFRIDFSSDPLKTIDRAREQFLKRYPEWKGKKFVLLSDVMVGDAFEPMLQVREF